MKKTITLCMSLLTLGSIVIPSTASTVVYAEGNSKEMIETTTRAVQPETIYKDEYGNIFTNSEVIIQKGSIDPRFRSRSISAQPISIGILWKYENKDDGKKLRDTFRKVAISDGTLGAVAGLLGVAGIASGGITAVLGAITAATGKTVADRFNEAADKINENPDSGKIYMYIDHVTYDKL